MVLTCALSLVHPALTLTECEPCEPHAQIQKGCSKQCTPTCPFPNRGQAFMALQLTQTACCTTAGARLQPSILGLVLGRQQWLRSVARIGGRSLAQRCWEMLTQCDKSLFRALDACRRGSLAVAYKTHPRSSHCLLNLWM